MEERKERRREKSGRKWARAIEGCNDTADGGQLLVVQAGQDLLQTPIRGQVRTGLDDWVAQKVCRGCYRLRA